MRRVPRVQLQQQRGQGLHGHQFFAGQAQVAVAQRGQRGAELRRALHARRLAVAVHQHLQGGARGGRGGGQRDLGCAVRRQGQAHGQCGHRVQAGGAGAGGGCRIGRPIECRQRLPDLAQTAEPARPVGQRTHRRHTGAGLGHKVHGVQASLGLAARFARQVQGLRPGVPVGADKEVGEGRVHLVGACFAQADLEGRQQLQRDRPRRGVPQVDAAQFDVVLGADPDRDAAAQVGPGGVQADAVGVELRAVLGRRVGRGMLGQRHRQGVTRTAQVEEAAAVVAQRVVAAACDVRRAQAAEAGAVGAQRHAVAAVGHDLRALQRVRARVHLARQALAGVAGFAARHGGGGLLQPGHLTRHALLQQRCHGGQPRIGHGPMPGQAVQQHIGQRHQRHALVVGHEGADECVRMAAVRGGGVGGAAGLAAGGVVQRFDEAPGAACTQRLQPAQVGHGGARRDQRRQRGGVRGDHALVGRRAAQRQARHALRRVLVGQAAVGRGVGRFADAPGHPVPFCIGLLLLHGHAAGAGEGTALGFVQDQRRHQVLEHRARPRAQAHTLHRGLEGPAQRRPVRRRHVALGDGPQAGQPRFAGQQVVVALVELLLGDAPADVQQAPAGVVQEGEIGGLGDGAAACGQAVQMTAQCGLGWCLVAGRGHGQQVAAEVAAVHRGDIGRRQRLQRGGVGPVHEVATFAWQAVQRVQRELQPLRHLRRADPAKGARAGQRQQVHADVGGRGAFGHHGAGHGLHVVRWQVVGAGIDVGFEPGPGVGRDALQVVAVLRRQRRGCRRRAAGPGHPQRRQCPQRAQRHSERRRGGLQRQQRRSQHQRQHRHAAVHMQQRQAALRGCRLGLGRGGPLQQAAAADPAAPERAHDGVDEQQAVPQPQCGVPQQAQCGTRQVGPGLAHKVAQCQVVPARCQAGHRAHQRAGAEGGRGQDQGPQRRQRVQQAAPGQGDEQQQQRCRCHQRSAQVVQQLPAVDGT